MTKRERTKAVKSIQAEAKSVASIASTLDHYLTHLQKGDLLDELGALEGAALEVHEQAVELYQKVYETTQEAKEK